MSRRYHPHAIGQVDPGDQRGTGAVVDRPKAAYFVDDLPKTRSAKILRRMIRRVHLGERELGDLSSLANPEALEAIARAR